MSTTPPEVPAPPETEPVPTWTRDLLRVLGISLFGALFVALFVWLASAGFMREKGSSDTLEADAVWAGICAGVLVFMFPFLFFENKRADNGFRRDGLVPLVLLSVVGGGVIITLVLMIWPLFLGDRALPGTVAAELGGDPASVLLVLFFVIAGMAWCLGLLLPMMVGGYKVALALLLPYLCTPFLFPLMGVTIFENPPSSVSTVIWAGVALAGLAVLTILAGLRTIIDPPQPQMTEAERAEIKRRHLEQRHGLGQMNGDHLPGIDDRQPTSRLPQPPPHPTHPPQRHSQPSHLPRRPQRPPRW